MWQVYELRRKTVKERENKKSNRRRENPWNGFIKWISAFYMKKLLFFFSSKYSKRLYILRRVNRFILLVLSILFCSIVLFHSTITEAYIYIYMYGIWLYIYTLLFFSLSRFVWNEKKNERTTISPYSFSHEIWVNVVIPLIPRRYGRLTIELKLFFPYT